MKTLKVVAAIIIDGKKILIAQRGYGDLAGFYEFPGGKVESNETCEEALTREIFEELNIKIRVKDFFVNVQYDYPSFHLDMDCFICEMLNNHIVLESHNTIKWIEHIDQSIRWCPADKIIIQKMIEEGLIG